MAAIFQSPLDELIQYEDLKQALMRSRGPLAVCGCVDSQKVHLACEVSEALSLCLIVTCSEVQAREIFEDAQCFGPAAVLYPARDVLFSQADIQGNLLSRERMAVLKRIVEGEGGIVVTTIDGCMDGIVPPQELLRRRISLAPGDGIDLEKMREDLTALGYEREPEVDLAGQFSIRGGILDVFPLTSEHPVRIELWGDEIDSIRSFDCESQRSLENLERVVLYAAAETAEGAENCVTLPDYFPEEAAIFLDEPLRLEEKAKEVYQEYEESMAGRQEKGYVAEGPAPVLFSPGEVFAKLTRGRTVMETGLEPRRCVIRERQRFSIEGRTVFSYEGHFDALIHDLRQRKKEGWRVVLLSGSRTRAERLAGDLRDYDLAAFCCLEAEEKKKAEPGQILVTRGNIHKSFEYPQIRFAVLSEGDLFGRKKKRRRRKSGSPYSGQRIREFSDLVPGDYVIHENHGLGIYQGIENMEIQGTSRDYIKITYGDGGNLYIPVTQMDQVQKYASSDTDRKPKLNSLGGSEWTRTRTRVRREVKDIADDLVRLYAARSRAEGFVYSPDTVWQKEFEEQFPYEETDDQLRAIEAVKADMESGKVMDRLICGDVGYGKTEIALRAAFKAVQDGKQVAYLAPTTILAQQHYNTFVQRMKDYPIGVELLCRFRTPKEQQQSLERLRKGVSDIAVGTHRLLSKDVVFKDLGLLIIDEEQRFGVSAKEKIKTLRTSVDVLSLTATPIPRTLHMSLIGIRDMSVLEEPPMDRLPIQTYVMEYNDELVREAISRELERHGQVYYVYNRVKNIREITDHIAGLVPDARVAFAHGQMKERELEQIMLDFINGETDVLVSTTIIETGLDISNTNTIIIHDADRFGLAQLYQLRGRVGRTNRQAYAFLLYRRDKMLKEVAEKRLSAIREYTELGSGIRISMRDLEIRGAGNLLGAEQHGHMEAVGYDLYCKLLSEAVQEAKGEKTAEDFETGVDLEVDACIPVSYVRDERQRMDLYRRISGIETDEDREDMEDELLDRFGEPPKEVENLLRSAQLRSLAHEAYVTDLTGNRTQVKISMYAAAPVEPTRIPDLISRWNGNLKLIPGQTPGFLYTDRRKENKDAAALLACVKNLLTDIKTLID